GRAADRCRHLAGGRHRRARPGALDAEGGRSVGPDQRAGEGVAGGEPGAERADEAVTRPGRVHGPDGTSGDLLDAERAGGDGAPASRTTPEVSTPWEARKATSRSPKPSSLTAPIMVTAAPARDAATAWLAPFPPGW